VSLWVVVGSGPSAPSALIAARHDHGSLEVAEVVTCNGGYALFDAAGWPVVPTLYLLVDPVGCRKYGDHARALRAANGTRIISITGRMPDADMYLRIEPGQMSDEYRPGRHPARRLSGLYMLDYALSHGADTVLIIGFDGYRSRQASRVKDYFDGRVGHNNSWRHGNRIATYLAGAVRRRPNVRFVLYADPQYRTPHAPNFRLVRIEPTE
jgi:hypothetical protein